MSDWDRLPVDEVGYIHPSEILELSKRELLKWTAAFEHARYSGWRNHQNLWRETLGLDTTTGKHIIDWGCGYGIEALQFARRGNDVTLYDLTDLGLVAAQRVLNVHGFEANITRGPLPDADIFYANGSLHHTPDAAKVLADARAPEARLMVYSDRAFDAHGPRKFVKKMDRVSNYTDWYSPEKLAAIAPDWDLREATYITPNGHYLTATLDRR